MACLSTLILQCPNFQEIEIDSHTLNKYFHVQLTDGTFVRGVDAFMEIWKRLPGWSILEKLQIISFLDPF